MRPYPLLLRPIAKTALWGGTRLKHEYGIVSEHEIVSEGWMLTCRPDAENTVLNGELAGKPLGEALRTFGVSSDGFPLLVKLIDARDKLSVQVHPSDEYARQNGIDSGKTEMWVVLDAAPGARLIAGLAPGVSREDFRKSVESGDFLSNMREVEVQAGDVLFIPAGLIHAIGAGILIAEIQENSDTTYRVYDYDRRDASGMLRELHLENAFRVIREISDGEIMAERFSAGAAPVSASRELLADCGLFRVERLVLGAGESEILMPCGSVGLSVLVTAGELTLECSGDMLRLKPGASLLLPLGAEPVRLSAVSGATLLLSSAHE